MNTALRQRLPQMVTAAIFVLLFAAAGARYANFASAANFANLFIGNACTGITAIGMTLVIFSGGIDLSVGAVAAFTNIFVAVAVEQHGVHPLAAALAGLAIGTGFGAAMGALIHYFKQPPFLITLAGMFFARGCAHWISTDSIDIKNGFFLQFSRYAAKIGGVPVHPLPAYVFLAVFAVGYLLAQHTRFGRNLLAIGGSEQSALLMGLPVGASKIAVYALCGACAALAGLVSTLVSGGDSTYGIGMELDAIAIVVIGGTLLTGGRGHMFGTLCGFLIIGTIQAAITFDGSLSSWWTRIITGALLLAFIFFQRLLLRATQKRLSA
ncbi:MAG TPA: galactofuranose ABC transporter, permease protein YjfF [Opitutales bacterium]|nr:galactofuranose ABC transporter, permease protein YjfF [Opitutales bacterium]